MANKTKGRVRARRAASKPAPREKVRLFGTGGANLVGQTLYQKMRKALRPLLRHAVERNYDLYDFELMVCRAIELDVAIARMPVQSRRVPKKSPKSARLQRDARND